MSYPVLYHWLCDSKVYGRSVFGDKLVGIVFLLDISCFGIAYGGQFLLFGIRQPSLDLTVIHRGTRASFSGLPMMGFKARNETIFINARGWEMS